MGEQLWSANFGWSLLILWLKFLQTDSYLEVVLLSCRGNSFWYDKPNNEYFFGLEGESTEADKLNIQSLFHISGARTHLREMKKPFHRAIKHNEAHNAEGSWETAFHHSHRQQWIGLPDNYQSLRGNHVSLSICFRVLFPPLNLVWTAYVSKCSPTSVKLS